MHTEVSDTLAQNLRTVSGSALVHFLISVTGVLLWIPKEIVPSLDC